MVMIPRTRSRKLALAVRIVAFLSVTSVFLVLESVPKKPFRNGEVSQERSPGRKLLAIVNGTNCTPATISEFPDDGFTRLQRQNGWIVLHMFFACYCFVLLAKVCDDFFVPAIKRFCDLLLLELRMSEDVAGATFMAIASSSPELFINCVGTFVTEGDIGVGTIVGSAVFNILAVPACCGLFANMALQLEWWPITRDSIMYGVSVIMLISVLIDGKIEYYEAVMLVSAYIFYILVIFFNKSINNSISRLLRICRRKRNLYKEIMSETHPLLGCPKKNNIHGIEQELLESELTLKDCEEFDESTKIWEWPSEETRSGKAWWIFTWPISFLLYMTTPDCKKHPKLYVITFLMCIIWIGTTSYITAWLITVIGDTLNIPDSVMGLTFLAAGTSVPEAVSSVIVTNQGHGSMGLSSSIGSNTFDILLCLGIPWLIKSHKGTDIIIKSGGIAYSAISLFSTILLLYFSLALNKFTLDWKIGLSCLLMYFIFLIFASLMELNVFFEVNLPTCDR